MANASEFVVIWPLIEQKSTCSFCQAFIQTRVCHRNRLSVITNVYQRQAVLLAMV